MISSRFNFREITIDKLKIVCKDLNNKPYFKRISTKIIINSWNVVGRTLLDIKNKPITMGCFLNNWKVSMINQIQKIPKIKLCEEFRAINTLKTCERKKPTRKVHGIKRLTA